MKIEPMLEAPNLRQLSWIRHGFGWRDSEYPEEVRRVRQIHSDIVLEATSTDSATEGDALVSNQAGVVVGIRTADCVPVLLADERTRSVAAVHAGWRGSARNIVAATVRELVTRYGARAEDLHVAIGPAIGPCCYEVGPEVARHFALWAPELAHAETPLKIDLARLNAMQLARAGVRDIWVSQECTYCRPDRYFSFRREREEAGRMTSFIGVFQEPDTRRADPEVRPEPARRDSETTPF